MHEEARAGPGSPHGAELRLRDDHLGRRSVGVGVSRGRSVGVGVSRGRSVVVGVSRGRSVVHVLLQFDWLRNHRKRLLQLRCGAEVAWGHGRRRLAADGRIGAAVARVT